MRPLDAPRFLFAALLAATTALAQPAPAGPASPTLAANRLATVTKEDLDIELLRLPPEMRPGFWNQSRRVHELVENVLLTKSLGAEARARGIDRDPDVAARLQAEIDRFLGLVMIVKAEEQAGAEFDAKVASYEARAREIWRVERARYALPEQVSVTHVLFKTDTRSSDEARRLAAEARARIVAGADFRELARASSEDQSAAQNSGLLDYFTRESMDPAFAAAAFALKKPGDLSEPVQSRFGWHVIRLEGRKEAGVRPYEEVRGELIASMRRKYVDDRREALLGAIRADPSTRFDQAAIEALIIRPDPAAVRRAIPALPPAPAAPK